MLCYFENSFNYFVRAYLFVICWMTHHSSVPHPSENFYRECRKNCTCFIISFHKECTHYRNMIITGKNERYKTCIIGFYAYNIF